MIIDINKFDDSKISIYTDDKLPNEVTLKNIVTLISYILEDGEQQLLNCPQLFLEETLIAYKLVDLLKC